MKSGQMQHQTKLVVCTETQPDYLIISRRPSGLRKTSLSYNSLAHRTTWLRSDLLFAGISGAPAGSMFHRTFYGCSKLTSIPENLFGNISGTAQNQMFDGMFMYCTSLTGPSARINGQYLYEIWPDATSDQVGGMYRNATGLSDYSNIPSAWK